MLDLSPEAEKVFTFGVGLIAVLVLGYEIIAFITKYTKGMTHQKNQRNSGSEEEKNKCPFHAMVGSNNNSNSNGNLCPMANTSKASQEPQCQQIKKAVVVSSSASTTVIVDNQCETAPTANEDDNIRGNDSGKSKTKKEQHFVGEFNPSKIIAASKAKLDDNDNKNNNDNDNNNSNRDGDGDVDVEDATKPRTIKKKGLPKVVHLGSVTMEVLNAFDCNHPSRQCLSIFGTVYDVTAAQEKYGPNGTYKEFAGHDITLALASGKLDVKWLDKFVQLSKTHKECAYGWMDLYRKQYPVCGLLEKYCENSQKWPKLTGKEMEELNAECIVM